MSLFDVLSGKQSFGSWFTGRDEREADVYANPEKASFVVETINGIAKNNVEAAQVEIYAAISRLNSVNGLLENVGGIDSSFYDSLFSTLQSTISDLATQMQNKIDDIKIYEESSGLEKLGSTLAMGIFKVSEGVLSVAEDLGDGVLAVVGFVGNIPGLNSLQDWSTSLIEKEWSHDIFNGYYESDFAKMSAITEDSGAAGTLKIVGKTVGYLYAGGVVTGLTGMSGATGVGAGILKASGSTWGATIAAGVGGLGSGTEAGLNAGLDYNSAVTMGVKEGGIQAGLAFAGGKIGEGLQKRAAVKAGTASSDAKWSEFQGYSGSITQAGERFGVAERNLISSTSGLVSAEARNLTSGIRNLNPVEKHMAEEAVDSARDAVHDSLGVLAKENPITQGVSALKGTGSALVSAPSAIRGAVSDAVSVVRSDGVFGAIKSGGSAVLQGAQQVVTSPVFPGVVATAAGSAFNEYISENGQQFRDASTSTFVQEVASVDPTRAVLSPTGGEQENGVGVLLPSDSSPSFMPTTGASQDGGGNPSSGSFHQTIPDSSVGGSTNVLPISDTSGDTSVLPVSDSSGDILTNPSDDRVDDSSSIPGTDGRVSSDDSEDAFEPVDLEPVHPSDEVSVGDTTPSTIPEAIPSETVVPIPVVPSGEPSSVDATPVDGASGEYHSGGGYDGSELLTDSLVLENADDLELLDELEESATSLDDIISGGTYQKIPTSSIPVSTKKNGSSVIPIAAGLSAAAAAGIGAKAYMDYKKNNDTDDEEYDEEFTDEYQEDGFGVEEWNANEEESISSDYTGDAVSSESEFNDYLEEEPSYSARNNNELLEIE